MGFIRVTEHRFRWQLRLPQGKVSTGSQRGHVKMTNEVGSSVSVPLAEFNGLNLIVMS